MCGGVLVPTNPMPPQARKPFLFDVNEFERQFRALDVPPARESDLRALKDEQDALKSAIGGAKEGLERVITLQGKSIPLRVAEWMLEHGLPWEVFWCYEHSLWVEELDSSFPYFAEFNQCCKCQEGL